MSMGKPNSWCRLRNPTAYYKCDGYGEGHDYSIGKFEGQYYIYSDPGGGAEYDDENHVAGPFKTLVEAKVVYTIKVVGLGE